MTQLPIASLPGLPTSAQALQSRPAHWRTWAGESKLSRFWRQELLVSDLQPMQQQLGLLSAALEEAVRVRCVGGARPAVEEAVQQLDLAVLEHQHFLTTLDAGWHALYEFPSYQRLLRSLREAVRAWQQSVLLGDARETEHFRHCELLGWRLLGDASLLVDMFADSVRGVAAVADESGPSVLARALRRRQPGWLARAARWLRARLGR